MAKPNKANAPAMGAALASPEGIAWLERELAARRTERHTGPANLGWRHNEGMRAPLEERIAFLEALLALVQPK